MKRDQYDGLPYFCECGEVHPSITSEACEGECSLEAAQTATARKQKKRKLKSDAELFKPVE